MTPNEQTTVRLVDKPGFKIPRSRTARTLVVSILATLLSILLITVSVLALLHQQTSGNNGKVLRGTPTTSASATTGQTPTPTPTFTPTPAPTLAPTTEPAQTPVMDLPETVNAQIVSLQAHDRFFYGGNPALPEIALTFDDGPNPNATPQVLAILKRYHIHATFFTLGRLVQLYPDLVRQEIDAGCVVGDHTWSHPYLPGLTPDAIKKQIGNTSDMLEQVTGMRPIFFRPPYGAPPFGGMSNGNVLKIVNSFGLTTVIWNNDARDWSLPGTSTIVARVLASARNGSIILLHDGGGPRQQTVDALPTIIESLLARHFHFVTMAQLVANYHVSQFPPASSTPTPATTPTSTPALPVGNERNLQNTFLAWHKAQIALRIN